MSGTRVHVQQRVISMCQWFLLFNIWSIFKLIFIHSKTTISFIYRAFLEKIPTAIYCFKVNNGNMKTICKTCSNITMKKLEKRQKRCSGIFIVNFEHISHIFWCFHCWILTSKCRLSGYLLNNILYSYTC